VASPFKQRSKKTKGQEEVKPTELGFADEDKKGHGATMFGAAENSDGDSDGKKKQKLPAPKNQLKQAPTTNAGVLDCDDETSPKRSLSWPFGVLLLLPQQC